MKAIHVFGRAVRETGQALDRFGLALLDHDIYLDHYSRHRTVMNLYDKVPSISKEASISPSASVIGNVTIGPNSSVWYGAVVRGDFAKVNILSGTNVQDRAVLATSDSSNTSDLEIGENVTIGHGALITSSKIGNNCLIGQGSIVQEGCVVGDHSIVAAGAVVLPRTHIGEGELWSGNPAVMVRKVTEAERAFFKKSADNYTSHSKKHAQSIVQQLA